MYLQYRVCVMLSTSMWLMKRVAALPGLALVRPGGGRCGTSWGCRDSHLDIPRDQPGKAWWYITYSRGR